MSELKNCPECKAPVINNDNEEVCSQCGLVIKENLVTSEPDWNSYNIEEVRHTGAYQNLMMHDKGLSTEISWQTKDYSGRSISQKTLNDLNRMRKMQRRGSSPNQHNLILGLNQINLICDKLNLPFSIKEQSSMIYRKAAEFHVTSGRSVIGIIAAAIYYVCRENQIPKSMIEISNITNINKKILSANYSALIQYIPTLSSPKPHTFTKYISKIGDALNIPNEKQMAATKLLLEIQKNSRALAGKDPRGLATAAIYLVCLNCEIPKTTQTDLAKVEGITEVTVRNRYKDLQREINKIHKKEVIE